MNYLTIAKVLVRRPDGKYLMLTGSVWPERPERSQKPDLPGGMVDPGETIYDAAVREAHEEAGISVDASKLQLVYADTFTHHDGPAVRTIFMVDTDEADPEVTLSWEHDAYQWLTVDEVRALDIREPYPKIFAYLSEVGLLV